MRRSGIILPIFSLPSNYGIGTFGKEAYKFVDFLKVSRQSLWQILPVGPTSYGDSPYQSFSTFAGNPYFIDLDMLVEDGLLNISDIENLNFGEDENYIDYAVIYQERYKVLKKAYKNRTNSIDAKVESFREKNKYWIDDYAMFMALKDYNNGTAWNTWDDDIKFRTENGILKYKKLLKEEIKFYIFIQYLFFVQWEKLKIYANRSGIKIIGDIPIYVAEDSSDVWSNTKLFMLDENLIPLEVAGCPPDSFSETGQLWGNPIYNWDEMEKDKYKWWVRRVKDSRKIFDIIRIDHFRGFEAYWSIPFGNKTAVNGEWKRGPGIKIFDAIKKELGDIEVIAEDLGYITKEVRNLLNKCGYPGMKVLQFSFDPKGDSEYLPHNYTSNNVVYTGTHDNETIKGWYESLSKEEKEFCNDYSGMRCSDDNWEFIKLAFASVADIAMIQIQDIINIGSEGRINTPSTVGVNWKWRLRKDSLSKEMAEKLKKITKTYRRCDINIENF